MKIPRFLCLPLLSAAFASAQVDNGAPPRFSHDALNCMSTEDHPLIEALFDPAEYDSLRKAQVYFKAGQTNEWYFVEMEPSEPSRLQAALPRPLAETAKVDYYLFFLSGTFEPSQSEEFSVSVSETGCGNFRRAATTLPPSLTLNATVANQTPVPAGFSPQGISGLVTTAGNTVTVGAAGAGAASGGISGATIAAVVGGGAAAAAAVAVTQGSEDSESGPITSSADTSPQPAGSVAPTPSPPNPEPTPTPSPAPTPPPAPSVPDVSGTWTMNYRIVGSCDPSLVGRTSTTPMELTQNGTAVTGTRNGPNFTENLTGTIDMAGNITMRGPFSDESDSGESRIDAATTTGSDISGRYVRIYPEHNCTIRWTLDGAKN